MTKAREARKPHRTVRRDVLDLISECGGGITRAEIVAAFPERAEITIDNAIRGLSREGHIRAVGTPRNPMWRIVSGVEDQRVDLRSTIADEKAEARFAELMGPRRYESVRSIARGSFTGQRPETYSAVGCAAALCLG